MAQVIYSEDALSDVDHIIEFLLDASPAFASRALDNIHSAISLLGVHPLIGRRVDGNIRELVISRGHNGYVALYRFDAAYDVVRVLRLRHQREAGYRE